MAIKPLGHHVLVHVKEPEVKSKGGIVIPEQIRDAEKRGAELGMVVAVGPTAWMAEGLGGVRWAEEGDRVWFAKYGGKWVEDPHTQEKYLILLDTDIIAKLEED